jgi:hypothetical protein
MGIDVGYLSMGTPNGAVIAVNTTGGYQGAATDLYLLARMTGTGVGHPGVPEPMRTPPLLGNGTTSATTVETGTVYHFHSCGSPSTALCPADIPEQIAQRSIRTGMLIRNGHEYAGPLGHAELAVQQGGGHYAWLDDRSGSFQTLARFCTGRRPPDGGHRPAHIIG